MAVDAAVMGAAPEATANPASEPMQAAPTAEPVADASPDAPTADQSSSAAVESVEATTTEDAKTRSERRAEAPRLAAEQKAAADAKAAEDAAFQARLDAALQERDRLASERAAREAADKAAREKFSKFFGTPEEQAELSRVANQMAPTIGDYDTADEIAQKNKTISEINAARAKLNELSGRWEMRTAVQEEERLAAFAALADEYETGATLEGVDAAAYHAAPNVTAALKVLRDSVWASAQAPLLERIADLEADLKIAESERSAAQAAAGGQLPGALAGGTGGGFNGPQNREQFLALPKAEKERLRREQPNLVAELYARSA